MSNDDEKPRFDSTVAMSPEELEAELDAAERRRAAAPPLDSTVFMEPSEAKPALDVTVETGLDALAAATPASVRGTRSVPPVAATGDALPWLSADHPTPGTPAWMKTPPSSRRPGAGPVPDAPFGAPAERVVRPPTAGAQSTMPVDAAQADALSRGVLAALAKKGEESPPWLSQASAPAEAPEAKTPPKLKVVRAEPAKSDEPIVATEVRNAKPVPAATPKRRAKRPKTQKVRAVPPRRDVNDALYNDD